MTGWSRGEEQPDLYRILGLSGDASHADIVHAYRRQARAVHPDARPADPDASVRFRALTQAYEVLSDPSRRAAYDQQRAAAPPPLRPDRPAGPRRRPAWPGPGVPLWAGPVHVDPPAAPQPAPPSQRAVLLAYLIGRHLAGDHWAGDHWAGEHWAGEHWTRGHWTREDWADEDWMP